MRPYILALTLSYLFVAKGLGYTVNDCPTGLKRDEYLTVHGDSCYQFFMNERKTFQEAQDYCVSQGGQLALVKSESVDKYLRETLTNTFVIYYSSVWIGLRATTDAYVWSDGSKMGYNDLSPDDKSAQSNRCVALSPKGKHWLSYLCELQFLEPQKNRFICEYAVNQTTTPPTKPQCPMEDTNRTAIKILDNKCYFFGVKDRMPFQEAEEFCEKNGGTLALIKSGKQNDFIQHHIHSTYNLSSVSDALWIGLTYNEKGNYYKWVDNTDLDYNNFKKYSFHEFGCVAISPTDGRWKKEFCSKYDFNAKHYICEFNMGSTTATKEPETVTTKKLIGPTPVPKDEICPVGSGDYIQVIDNTCYYFSLNQSLQFSNAEAFCEKYGGTLAMPKSKMVNEFLEHHLHITHKLGYSSEALWIGLRKTKSYYSFQWIDVTKVEYKNFKSKYPKGDCAAISPLDGVWVTSKCLSNPKQDSRNFICQFQSKHL